MKRMTLAATLAVAALGLAARPADAGHLFNCLGCRKSAPCWHKCSSEFLVRQYNAFTPICVGSLHCDGMAPMTFGNCCPPADCCPPPAHGHQGYGQHLPPQAGPANCNCCDGHGGMGPMPAMGGMYPSMPMMAGPGYPPARLPGVAGGQPMMMPPPGGAPAGMYPYPAMMAAPGYGGMPMMPGAMPAPGYGMPPPGYGMPAPMAAPAMPMAAMPAMPGYPQ